LPEGGHIRLGFSTLGQRSTERQLKNAHVGHNLGLRAKAPSITAPDGTPEVVPFPLSLPLPHNLRDVCMQQLRGDFGKYVHALNLGCDSELLAGSLLHAQDPSVAAYPALLSGGQFGREDEDQFDV
jgi:hypothetical protein